MNKSENASEQIEGRGEKKVKTIWQHMKEEAEDRFSKFTPERLKEMEERWKATSEENETEIEQ